MTPPVGKSGPFTMLQISSTEMRELSMKMPEQAEDPEEVVGAALDAALENVIV